MRCLESSLVMTIDRRLPKELHEACEAESVSIIWLQKLAVDLLHHKLEFVLVQHCMIHIVVSVHLHQIGNWDYFFA